MKALDLVVGRKVKILRGRYAGQTGIIADFNIKDDQVDVQLDNSDKICYLGLDDIRLIDPYKLAFRRKNENQNNKINMKKLVKESLNEEGNSRGRRIIESGKAAFPTYYGISKNFGNSKWAKELDEAGISYSMIEKDKKNGWDVWEAKWKTSQEGRIVRNIVKRMLLKLYGKDRGWAQDLLKDWNRNFYGKEIEN